MTTQKRIRCISAHERLVAQLKGRFKPSKEAETVFLRRNGKVELTDADVKRINKEIEVLATKLRI